jgi:hypothetical protein
VALSAPSRGEIDGAIGPSAVAAGLSSGVAPIGTITFTLFGPQSAPPTSCSSQGTTVGTATVSGNGSYTPSAGFTPMSAGDYWWYASYGGDASDNPAASACGPGMAETVIPQATPSPGTAHVGHATVSGKRARVPLSCTGGTPCTVALTLSVTERLRHGEIIAIGASRKHKRARKHVVLAARTVTLSAGRRKTVTLKLNASGRRLLARRHRLKVTLTAVQAHKAIATQTLKFRAKSRHPARHAHRS